MKFYFSNCLRIVQLASLPPVIQWLLPDWINQRNLREEDVEPDPLLLLLRKAKLAEIRKQFVKVSNSIIFVYHYS